QTPHCARTVTPRQLPRGHRAEPEMATDTAAGQAAPRGPHCGHADMTAQATELFLTRFATERRAHPPAANAPTSFTTMARLRASVCGSPGPAPRASFSITASPASSAATRSGPGRAKTAGGEVSNG